MSSRRISVIEAVAVLALISGASLAAPETDLGSILSEAQRLIQEGNVTEALELLDEGRLLAESLEQENLVTMEEYLWQAAMTHLDFSNQLTNQEQYREYARRAQDRWRHYIEWYDRLTDQQKASLPENHVRIMRATVHLGNAIVRKERPRELFNAYSDIADVRYLSSDAFLLWKNWLYGCPEMKPVSSGERTPELRKRKICTDACTEDWLAYADTLSEWANEDWASTNIARPRESVLNRRSRECAQIKAISEECGV